ncbi:hypothetical protein NM688_g3819 [Phlebia brevispora]|uniref:Uncharacterized protein n=1 Tax=Phlebia brevispora TaxID=194682 RepID=A0ACC1T4U4_9APHY|nr:hypothetical protein NM688_g3819 [Phlebia brevispora]
MASTMHQDMYRGRAKDAEAFMTVSIPLSLILTGIAVVMLYLRDDLKTKRYLSSRRAISAEAMIVLLLSSLEFYHVFVASVLRYYTIQADSNLTFETGDPLHGAMMLTFTSTMANITMCQIFMALQVLMRMLIVLLCNRMLISLVLSVQVQDSDVLPPVFLKIGCTFFYFAQAAYFAFFASNAKDATLECRDTGQYKRDVLCRDIPHLFDPSKASMLSNEVDNFARHMLTFLVLIFVVFIVIMLTPRIGALVWPPPIVLWEYMDLAAYEVLGSLYPIIVISLTCCMEIPFSTDNEDDKKAPDQNTTSENSAVAP